jgi:hypothetical protein
MALTVGVVEEPHPGRQDFSRELDLQVPDLFIRDVDVLVQVPVEGLQSW